MTYKSPEYYALENNVAKQKTMLAHIDRARIFNQLVYVEEVTLIGRDRSGQQIETIVRGDLMKAILQLGAQYCVDAAKIIQAGDWEANNFERAAKV